MSEKGAEPVVLVAASEFVLKSAPVRRALEQRLMDDLRSALAKTGIEGFRVQKHAARFIVEGIRNAQETASTCARVFGVAYAAPCISVKAESATVLSTIVDLAKHQFTNGSSFAIRCHRSTPTTLSRREIEIRGGSEILKAMSQSSLRVDLDEPDVTISVDLADDRAYLNTSKLPGPSGLPVSAHWRMLSVLDSSLLTLLAAFAMMRRGCLVELLIPISNTDPSYEPTRQYAVARRLRALVPKQSYRAYSLSMDTVRTAFPNTPVRSALRAIAARFAQKKHYRGIVLPDTSGTIAADQQALQGTVAFHPLIGFEIDDLLQLCSEANVSREEFLSELSREEKESPLGSAQLSLEAVDLLPIERIQL